MTREAEMLDLLMPVVRTLIPKKTLQTYDVGHVPFSLWGSLHAGLFQEAPFERRIKRYLTHLARADELGWSNASNLVDKLARAPHTDFTMWRQSRIFWGEAFIGLTLNRRPRRESYTRQNIETKMNDVDLCRYLLAKMTHATDEPARYYEMLLHDESDMWERAKLRIATRTYLDLWDWWQTEGLLFKRTYPTRAAYNAAYKRQNPISSWYMLNE